jgi:transketolase
VSAAAIDKNETAPKAAEQQAVATVISWDRYAGATGAKVGKHTSGSSAPVKDLLTKFGFTPDKVVQAAGAQI